MKHSTRSLVCLLLAALLAAAALTGCAAKPETPATTEAQVTTVAPASTEAPATTAAPTTEAATETPATTEVPAVPDAQELGEGASLFYFEVTFSDGETASYAIHTDAETVGEALVALDLIAGEDSEYGLYVKTVGDETLDYTADGMYWAFYEDGAYAMTGVDATPVREGATYAFVAEKG